MNTLFTKSDIAINDIERPDANASKSSIHLTPAGRRCMESRLFPQGQKGEPVRPINTLVM